MKRHGTEPNPNTRWLNRTVLREPMGFWRAR